MANIELDFKDVLREYPMEYDLLQKVPCTDEENREYLERLRKGLPLPEGVVRDTSPSFGEELDSFYRWAEASLTDRELNEYLTYKKLKMLKTIKNCVIFFTVLAVIAFVGALFIYPLL